MHFIKSLCTQCQCVRDTPSTTFIFQRIILFSIFFFFFFFIFYSFIFFVLFLRKNKVHTWYRQKYGIVSAWQSFHRWNIYYPQSSWKMLCTHPTNKKKSNIILRFLFIDDTKSVYWFGKDVHPKLHIYLMSIMSIFTPANQIALKNGLILCAFNEAKKKSVKIRINKKTKLSSPSIC